MKGARLHKSRFITPALVRGVIVKAPVRRPRTIQEERAPASQPALRPLHSHVAEVFLRSLIQPASDQIVAVEQTPPTDLRD